MAAATDLLEEASARFLRSQRGQADADLDRWLAADEGRRLAFAQVSAAWYAAEPESSQTLRLVSSASSRVAAKPRWRRAAIASVVAAMMLMLLLLWQPRTLTQTQLSPELAARFSANSDARFDAEFRVLSLTKGRAWIDVNSAERGAIRVDFGQWFIRDIGTRFSVDADRQRIAVYEGAVEIHSGAFPATQDVELQAGEAFDFRSQQRVVIDALEQGADRMQWLFIDLSVGQALEELRRDGARLWISDVDLTAPLPRMVLPHRDPVLGALAVCEQMRLTCTELGPLGLVIAR